MPLKLRPGVEIPYTLRALSMDEYQSLQGMRTLSAKPEEVRKALDLCVCGWRSMPEPYSFEAVMRNLTPGEITELLDAALSESALTPEYRKKLESLRTSGTE